MRVTDFGDKLVNCIHSARVERLLENRRPMAAAPQEFRHTLAEQGGEPSLVERLLLRLIIQRNSKGRQLRCDLRIQHRERCGWRGCCVAQGEERAD